MATYCVGDVHGCYKELVRLLEMIGASSTDDQLWFVGDLVGRGPDSLAVLRLVKSLPNANAVLGNHEFHLLALRCQIIHPAVHTLHDVLSAPDSDELACWLRQRPLMQIIAINGVDHALVHAGIYPWWDLAAAQKYSDEVTTILRNDDKKEHVILFAGAENVLRQYQHLLPEGDARNGCGNEDASVALLATMWGDRPDVWRDELQQWERWRFIINAFTRMRFCDVQGRLDLEAHGKVGTQPEGFIPWFRMPERKTQHAPIVFGHWAALEGKIMEDNLISLDTGCAWGGTLTAVRLEDRKVFGVQADKL